MMKTSSALLILAFAFGSCNNEATINVKVDTLKNEVERLDKKVDSVSEKLKDSVNHKWKNLKLEIEKKTEKTDSGKK